MVSYIITFLVGALIGVFVARNNIKKVNALVKEAEEAAKVLESKIDDLPAKWKKHLGK